MANFIVTTLIDQNDGSAVNGLSLREAVMSANNLTGADTISFQAGLTGTITLIFGELSITDALTINGDSSGDGIADINVSGDANDNDIADAGDSRVFSISADATLRAIKIIEGYTSNGSGGSGILHTAGALLVENAELSENVASGSGGSGGAILSNGGSLALNNVAISGNSAVRAGGGIEIAGGTDVTISGSDLEDNSVGSAPGNGGALHITGAGSIVNITGSTISGNSAASEGGGLWNSAGSTLIVTNSEITGNTASGAFADNGGGGIFNDGGTLTISGSNVTANIADGISGSGGGIFSTDGLVTIQNSNIDNNSAIRAGGGIEVVLGTANITGGSISGNHATVSPGNGGGLHVTGSGASVSITETDIIGNMAGSEGGGLWNSAGGTMTLNNVTVFNNTASGAAADNGGGGIFNNGGTLTIAGSSVTGNTANGAAGSGGGVFSASGGVTITESNIDNNSAKRAGGGIEVVLGTVDIFGGSISGNVAASSPGNGGGLHVSAAGTAVTITETDIIGNTASSEGGGLWNSAGGTMTIISANLSDNTASGADTDNGGGGIFNNGGTLTIEDLALSNNTADGFDGDGGSIFSTNGTVTITDSTVDGNTVKIGGGSIGIIAGKLDILGGSLVTSNGGDAVAISLSGAQADSDAVSEITAQVTVTKAQIADNAMNAITAYLQSGTPQDFDPLTIGMPLPGMFDRIIDIDDATVESPTGEGAIASSGSLFINAANGAVIRSSGNNAPVISVTEALGIVASDTVFSSQGANSPLLKLTEISAGAGTAASAQLTDVTATTAGVNSDALALGGGVGNSVGVLFIRASDPLVPGIVSTIGNGARAISFDAGEGSTFTSSIADAMISTQSIGAPAIHLDAGDNSSLSLELIESSVTTQSANSDALYFGSGSSSDLLVYLAGSTLSSFGDNSRLLVADPVDDGSIGNFVILDSVLTSQGNGSAGILIDDLAVVPPESMGSSRTVFAGDTTVSTAGDDAGAFTIGALSSASAQTLDLLDVTLSAQGARSGGLFIGDVGRGSAEEANLTDVTIHIGGDQSAGIDIGSIGGDSALSLTFRNVDLATAGMSMSPGIRTGGLAGDRSVQSHDLNTVSISTMGTDSPGYIVENIAGDESSAVFSIDMSDITTEGDNSLGIGIGTISPISIVTSVAVSIGNTTIETSGSNSAGLFLNQSGNGLDFADSTLLLHDNSITTNGDGSAGIEIEGVTDIFLDSTLTYVLADIDVQTSGTSSHGLMIGDLPMFSPDNNSNSVLTIDITNNSTTGDTSHGILLGQSWGTPGAMSGDRNNEISSRFNSIQVSGDISVTGEGSHGILSSSRLNDFTVISTGSVISTQGDAIALGQDLGINFEVFRNDGLISASNGAAIRADLTADADETITNSATGNIVGDIFLGGGDDMLLSSGTITGNIDMGSGANRIIIQTGGLLNSQDDILLGDGSPIVIEGDISPGGSGALQTTMIGSNLFFETGSRYLVDIDGFSPDPVLADTGLSDRLTIDGMTVLETGTQIIVTFLDPDPGNGIEEFFQPGVCNEFVLLQTGTLDLPPGSDIADFFTFTNAPSGFTMDLSVVTGGGMTSIVLTPIADPAPPVAADDQASTQAGTALQLEGSVLLANDFDINCDDLTVLSVGNALNGTVSRSGTTVTFTPDVGFAGGASFIYTISDGNGGTDTATVNINVTNNPPNAVDDTASVDEDAGPVTITVLTNDSDADGDTLTVTGNTQAANGVVTDNGGGNFSYTPGANFNGSDSFTYTISDATSSDTATVSITVNPVNDAPVAVDDTASVDEDSSVTVDVLANDSDIDGDALTVLLGTVPANGTASVGAGGITYTPGANFNGSDSFTYSISDGNGGSDTGTVTITVDPLNDAPVAQDDSASTLEGEVLSIAAATLLANDSDVDGDVLVITAVGGGVNGSASLNGSTVTFSPDTGFTGAASFAYTVSDGNGATDTATVNVTVNPSNLPPTADAARSVTTLTNTALVFDIAASDPDGDVLSFSASTPANGTISFDGNRATYAPTTGFTGSESITVTIDDDNGGTATQAVTITTQNLPASNQFVMFTADGFTGGAGGSGTINGTDAFQQISVIDVPGSVALDPSFNKGGDVLQLSGDAADWNITRSGSSALFSDGDTFVTVPIGTAGLAVQFDDGVRELVFDGSNFAIGGQAFATGTLSPITAAPDGTALPTGADPAAKAVLFIAADAGIAASGVVDIFGAAGDELARLISGNLTLDASFNNGGDTIAFDEAASDYLAVRSGSSVSLTGSDTTALIPVGTAGATLAFGDGSDTRTLLLDTTIPGITIGTQQITFDPVQLIAA